MAAFSYSAKDKTGKRIKGTVEASSAAVASQQLRKRNLQPISIKKANHGSFLDDLPLGKNKQKIKLKDMVVFTRQLATMINAGVPLIRSLATLQAQTENPNFKNRITQITKDIESGSNFADALEKHSEVFSPIYINMVRAGEAGGILDEILKKLALQQEKDAKIRGKFKSAMTYPIILLTITSSVFIVLMAFVMPRIGKIIIDLGGPDAELPALTRVLLGISDFMVGQWYVILGVTLVTVYFLRRYVKTTAGRRKKDELLLKVPILKTVIIKVAIARFARIFASLMSAGVSVTETLRVTSKAIGNAVVEDELLLATKTVENGQQLSNSLADSKVFPQIVSQMMAVGEETGKTGEILLKIADFYEDEVDVTVDSLSSILEPIMIVVMGVMVGLIAAGVIGPISSLSSQI